MFTENFVQKCYVYKEFTKNVMFIEKFVQKCYAYRKFV